MTPIEQELKRLAELEMAATPGPYYVGHMSEEYDTLDVHESKGGLLIAETVRSDDFRFWNAIRNAAPGLIEALSLAVEALEQEHDHLPTDDGTTYGNCRACIAISQSSEALLKGGDK